MTQRLYYFNLILAKAGIQHVNGGYAAFLRPATGWHSRMNTRRALTLSASACLLAALLGNMAVGGALAQWYASLRQPSFGLPFGAWLVVGVLYYLLMGTVLYRVLRFVAPREGRRRLVALVSAVLLGNELWNAVFFGLRSAFWGFWGLVIFLGPLLALWLSLWGRERVSGRILTVYLAWVVLYDMPWAFALWRLNLHA